MSVDIQKWVKELAKRHDLKVALAFSRRQWSSAMKRLHSTVCFYLIMHQSGDSGIQTNIWVAPLDTPDDGLDALGLGLCLDLGSTADAYDSYISRVSGKISLILENASSFVPLIIAELEHPRGLTPRGQDYLQDILVFEKLNSSQNDNWQQFLREFSEKARENAKYETLQTLTEATLSHIMQDEKMKPILDLWKGNSKIPEKFLSRVLAVRLTRIMYANYLVSSDAK